MDKTDTLYLFDAKMELHPEEESFSAQPTILLRSNSSNRCNGVLIGGIVVVVVGLIAGAFVAGYMIRSAVTKVSTDCKTDDKVSPTSLPPQIGLQDILALMSTKSIEHNLRLARQTTYVNLFFWYPNLSQSLFCIVFGILRKLSFFVNLPFI